MIYFQLQIKFKLYIGIIAMQKPVFNKRQAIDLLVLNILFYDILCLVLFIEKSS